MQRLFRRFRGGAGARSAVLLAAVAAGPVAGQSGDDRAFERELFKTRFEQEVKFRAAGVEVAWAAEALCHATGEIEPFVLLSVHALRRQLAEGDLALFRQVTGMDDKWRVVWLDEAAPEALHVGDAVVAMNGRALPGGDTRFEPGAWFKGGSVLSSDDQGFWDVVQQARREAGAGQGMRITLEDGRTLKVETQTGCAGAVTASAFDADPDVFWRQGNRRVKIPANAMIEARNADEFRWLAAFGTYFQASQDSIAAVQKAEDVSAGFTVGKILMLAVPGAGMLLSVAEAQAEKAIAVDGIVGSADLFANEVVAALGGDPAAGLRLSERMAAKGMQVDAVMMDAFRRSNAAEHVRRLKALQSAQAERERDQARAEAEAQRQAQRAAWQEALKAARREASGAVPPGTPQATRAPAQTPGAGR